MRLLALLGAAALAGACDGPLPAHAPDGGPVVDFSIGGLSFHASDGAAVTTSTLDLYLSDQPSACDAISATPTGTAMTLKLRVVALASGEQRAAVVPPKATPAPGEAVGSLSRATRGIVNATLDAVDGSVSWTASATGAVTLTALDLGFSGTADRLVTGGLLLSPCK